MVWSVKEFDVGLHIFVSTTRDGDDHHIIRIEFFATEHG